MIEHERRRLTDAGKSPSKINDDVKVDHPYQAPNGSLGLDKDYSK
jgi:hypothetical protein